MVVEIKEVSRLTPKIKESVVLFDKEGKKYHFKVFDTPVYELEIPYKFPSFNEYTNVNRKNKFAGARMKKQIQEDISWYIKKLPKFESAVRIQFTWFEANSKRDYDNVCANKKFILDALVEQGKLKDDNRKIVKGFTDVFVDSDEWKVILEIEEVCDDAE